MNFIRSSLLELPPGRPSSLKTGWTSVAERKTLSLLLNSNYASPLNPSQLRQLLLQSPLIYAHPPAAWNKCKQLIPHLEHVSLIKVLKSTLHYGVYKIATLLQEHS